VSFVEYYLEKCITQSLEYMLLIILFTSTSRQHLGSPLFFYGVRVAHLFSFPYCVFFIVLVLLLCDYLQNIFFTLSDSIINSIYSNDRGEPRCWRDVEVNRWCTSTCLDHVCLIYVFKHASNF
jgi:hypothetical protein